ncbi:hypothetical protein NL676_006635 [Syzygium grande]|nr:hypothetical protein NL676_006635 [Syzygium grande]
MRSSIARARLNLRMMRVVTVRERSTSKSATAPEIRRSRIRPRDGGRNLGWGGDDPAGPAATTACPSDPPPTWFLPWP